MATQPFIDFKAVKEQSDFAAVLAFYGLLPKRGLPRGRSVKITCPFHDDAEPSLSIDPAKKRFHCFGCGTKGNILEFVAEMEGLDRKSELRAAAEKLAEIGDVPLARSREGRAGSTANAAKKPRQARENRPALPELPPPELVRNPGCFALKFIEHQHPYLEKRGIPPDFAEEFGIGFYGGKGSMRERIVIPVFDWWPRVNTAPPGWHPPGHRGQPSLCRVSCGKRVARSCHPLPGPTHLHVCTRSFVHWFTQEAP